MCLWSDPVMCERIRAAILHLTSRTKEGIVGLAQCVKVV